MAKLPITIACWDYDRMQALASGEVEVEGAEANFIPLMMPEPAFRMLRHGEFDVAEMSLSWYTRTLALEKRPFIAIPVFPSKMFRHSSVYINRNSGITSPQDLVGKRIGMPEYQMTAAVWLKGIMADNYGVALDSVKYFTGGLEEPGRTETPFSLPENFSLQAISSEKTLTQMLTSGEIDALYTAHAPSTFSTSPDSTITRLWDDVKQIEKEYFTNTGIFPIMHVIVIRQDIYEQHPWLARSVMKAFEESKRIAERALYETTALKYMLPWLNIEAESTRELFQGEDPFDYGLGQRNRKVLDTFLRYSHEQHLSPQRFTPEDLFAPETLEISKI